MKRVPVREPRSRTVLYALVDDRDHARVSAKCWTLRNGHAIGNTTHSSRRRWRPRKAFARVGASITMQRFILSLETGDAQAVRHRNGKRLDNRRANLLVVTRRPNGGRTAREPERFSPYLGVRWDPLVQRWEAVAYRDGQPRHLGFFDDDSEAAVVSKRWRDEHPGEAGGWRSSARTRHIAGGSKQSVIISAPAEE